MDAATLSLPPPETSHTVGALSVGRGGEAAMVDGEKGEERVWRCASEKEKREARRAARVEEEEGGGLGVRLWELNPAGVLCGVEMYGGVMMRFVRGSSALLRKPEGSVDFDLSYYRRRWHCAATSGSRTRGKNRNVTFEGATAKYGGSAWAEEFERVRRAYDPEGLFTNEWSNQVLGIGEGVSVVRDGCALEGPCMCSVDTHCAPDRGYLCRPGRVYEEARVCRHSSEL
ncbi:hypothetical protein PR202_ga28051 [Eleusine coracana subsp. coracana]|uniref:L-gulonolactone oxidase 2-like C-terminal domain-containing protein n=1 Tax=Eleusine coracana subsp. coracana TaxID=191504 RepID=A0AAV5DHL1_ELECO|nr:hypothetical protein PR202_ga28051 [Eleusine coracana subsp. coracana]